MFHKPLKASIQTLNAQPQQMSQLEESTVGTVIANANVTKTFPNPTKDSTKTPDNATPAKRPLLTRLSGIAYMTVSSITATGQGVIFQYLSDMPTGMVLMVLSVFAASFLYAMITFQGLAMTFPVKLLPLFMARNIFTMITFTAKTWAFQNLPLGDASALIFTMPLWTGILARVFLKERYTIAQLFCTIIGLSGIVLVAKPTFLFPPEIEDTNNKPAWYPAIALLSGISMACEFTIQRGLGDTISSLVITFYMMICHTAAGLILHHAMGDVYINPVCLLPRVLLVLASLHPVIGLSCLMRGLAVESASTATLVKNLDTVLGFIVQVALFGDPADWLSVVGAALIILGTVTLTLAKMFNITCGVEL